ncbi:MAG: DNA-3-methyladenine glycosylase [Deltaproteobacteria bacterium]|nr:DNA-3-methyladenine glycosylase [Deltaproteobacteria bacterium]
MTLLHRSFFARPSPEVDRELIGMRLLKDDVEVRITEVEAYCGPADSASRGSALRLPAPSR